jgi:hypothetical protein
LTQSRFFCVVVGKCALASRIVSPAAWEVVLAMDDRASRRGEGLATPQASQAGAEVAAMVRRMRRAQDQANRTIMLVNAARSEAVERRIVAENARARTERT